MAILSPPPANIRDTKLFRILQRKSAGSDGASEKLERFLENAIPLVDLIVSGPFKEFTLHNRDHSKKLIHIADHILPSATLDNLSIVECLVLFYSFFLHDMGMVLTSSERSRILTSSEFEDTLRDNPELWESINRARTRHGQAKSDTESSLLETELYQLQEAGICNYLRPRHATRGRYKELISRITTSSGRNDLFEVGGASFREALIDICVSHNEDAGVLVESSGPYSDRFPRDLTIATYPLNMQFCAAVLRLVDILDFDRERTPPVLFDSLGISSRTIPGAEVSLKEWQKHMSVHSIDIREDEIVVSADCYHPVIEKTVREFCHLIEREIRDTVAILKRNPAHILNKYTVELPVSVRPWVRSCGYVFRDLSLRISQSAIHSLLMGERLYAEPSVAIRELVQNAVDACIARQKLEDATGCIQEVTISIVKDAADDRSWLEVRDNGIGMDEHVLGEYFLQLGTTYYNSPEFRRLLRASGDGSFVPIARFGIGIASVFMIGDVLEVLTQSKFSPRKDTARRRARIERMGGLAFITQENDGIPGTHIRVRLRPEVETNLDEFISRASAYIHETVVRPQCPVTVDLGESKFSIKPDNFFSLKTSAKDLLSQKNIELVALDLSRWSDRAKGLAVLLLHRQSDGQLSHLQNGHRISLQTLSLDSDEILNNYHGNRLTVNGFRMTPKKINRLIGPGKVKLQIIFDIEVAGDEEIVYDVSRDRILGKGRTFLGQLIRAAIISGLTESGVLQRMTLETREKTLNQLNWEDRTAGSGWIYHSQRPVPSDEILQKVAEMLPATQWPKNIHKLVAQQLGISKAVAHRSINVLLTKGKVQKPL